MTTLFTDSGAGADANPAGGVYTTLTGFNALQRFANHLEGAVASSNNGAHINSVANQTDGWIQSAVIGTTLNSAGLMLRCSTVAANGYLVQIYGTTMEIARWDAGSYVSRATASIAYTAGNVLYFQVVGTVLTAIYNAGTPLVFDTAADGTKYSTGRFGLYSFVDTNGFESITAGDFGGSSSIKTVDGVALASIKTFSGLAAASVKTVNGVTK